MSVDDKVNKAAGDDWIKYPPDNQEAIDKIHQRVIDTMKDGHGVAQVCVNLGIAERTFYYWVNQHPKFNEVYQLARTYCRAWWELRLHDNVDNRNFNERAWTRQVHNRFSETYCEGRKVKLKKLRETKSYSEDGQAIKYAIADGELTPDEALKIMQMLVADTNLKERTELEARLVELEKCEGKR